MSRKRVSYSLATPSVPPPTLTLPPPTDAEIRPSAPRYTVLPRPSTTAHDAHRPSHPTHCLGVTALALDTTTILEGHDKPRGILYTGGRDGLVASWDQGLPMRRVPGEEGEYVKWERIGVDDDSEEEEEGFSYTRSGTTGQRDRGEEWVEDGDAVRHGLGQPTFRQSLQTHTDWVNDLVLVNNGRTVITASSDRSIRAWQPHHSEKHDQPELVGVHRDYVKCLAFAPHPSLLFSGGLDRTINVWDIHTPKPYAPITSLSVRGEAAIGGNGDKGSVYALVCNQQGTLVASGTPERVIRLWDPRVAVQGGKSSAGQLVGHTDNVKALVMSEDGRYMLSGSSDSTVKLWSLAAQRAIHTFTHHSAPIWSLASTHPNLERFYSGDRAGNLCVTDLSGISDDWAEGECTLLARYERKRGERDGTEGVVRIQAGGGEVVWTANAGADVARWVDVGARTRRRAVGHVNGTGNGAANGASPNPGGMAGILGSLNPFAQAETRDSRVAFADSPASGPDQAALSPSGVPYASMIALGVTDSSGPYLARESVSHGPSLYTASAVSLPREPERAGHARGQSQASALFSRGLRDPTDVARVQYEHRDLVTDAVPLRTEPEAVIRGRPGLIRARVLNDRQHVLALDTAGKVSIWNIVKGVCVGTFDDAQVEKLYEAHHGLVYTAHGEVDSKEALDLVAEHVDGQSFVRQWCQVDTRSGNITVHLEEATCWDAEVYADQVGYANDPEFGPEYRINLGKWVLANLFAGLIKAEAAEAARHEQQAAPPSRETGLQRGAAPTFIALDRATTGTRQRMSSSGPPTPGGLLVGLSTPAATPAILPVGASEVTTPNLDAWAGRGRTNGTHHGTALSTIPQSPALATPKASTPASALSGAKSPKADANNGKDYFSFPSKKSKATTPGPITTKDPSPTRRPDPTVAQTPGGTQTSFIGKFKGFGGKSKKNDPLVTPTGNNAPLMSPREEQEVDEAPKIVDKETEHFNSLDEIRAQPFNPPYYVEAPPYDFPDNTAVIISETNQDAGAWAVTYRSMVSRVERDLEAVEVAAPIWLLEFLFLDRTKELEHKKLTFILEPWPDAEDRDRLPALPPATSRLLAHQTIRMAKVISYVCSRIDASFASRRGSLASVSSGRIRPATAPPAVERQADGMTASPMSGRGLGKFMAVEQAAAAAAASNGTTQDSMAIPDNSFPAEALELLCNGVAIPLDMTLAAVKQFIWNNPGVNGRRGPGLDLPSSADIVLHYRMRKNAL